MPSPTSPLSFFRDNACWSAAEWLERLGEPTFEGLKKVGALVLLPLADHDGSRGRFQISGGAEEIDLSVKDGRLLGHRDTGGIVSLEHERGMYVAKTEPFFSNIAKLNRLGHVSRSAASPGNVGVAENPDQQLSKLITILDDKWLDGYGAQEVVEKLARGTRSLVVATTSGRKSLPWSLDVTSPPRVTVHTLGAPNSWKLEPQLFFHPDFGTPIENLFVARPELKAVLLDRSKKLYLFGKLIDLQPRGRPFRYLAGVIKNAKEARLQVPSDEFAKTHLEDHENQQQTVRSARTGARRALEGAFMGDDLKHANALFLFLESEENMVSSRLRSQEVEIFDR